MKILLAAINAKYIHSNLAIYSLKACKREWNRGSDRKGIRRKIRELRKANFHSISKYG